jgi:hypothetical protein
MKIDDIIVEGHIGKKPVSTYADTGEWQFRDKGGLDRVYNLNRVMMAVAMADGKSTKPVDMDQESWTEKRNIARPYTEIEHIMMQAALNTVDSDYKHTEKDHRSSEQPTTYTVSPCLNPGPIKRRSK